MKKGAVKRFEMTGYAVMIVVFAAGIILGALSGWYVTGHRYCVQMSRLDDRIRKDQELIRLYDVWMMANESGISIGRSLEEQHIRRVAIYGMSALGVRLYHELRRESGIEVCYALDRDPQIQIPGITIHRPDTKTDVTVDAVIVTALRSYDAVSASLKKKGYAKVVALDEIIYDMLMGRRINDKVL